MQLSSELPSSPKLYLITITGDSASLMWKLIDTSFASKLSGYGVHYKAEFWSAWKEISLPAGVNRDEGEYLMKGLQENTVYYIYVTAINNYGHGDPSELLTIRTRAAGDGATNSMFNSGLNAGMVDFQQQILSFISITVAVVIVILVVIISYVCVKKAQLDATKPPLNLMMSPRELEKLEKSGVYVGTTHRYVDFDQRPLMQGNVAHLIDAQGNMYPAHQFATLAAGTSTQQHPHEEMKSFIQATPVSVCARAPFSRQPPA